jgi:hypothetical protein
VEYQREYDNILANNTGFLPYSIEKLVKQFNITTKEKADANFHSSNHDTTEWVAFRAIQLSKLIKKIRHSIGPGKTNKSDYLTGTIRMSATESKPLTPLTVGIKYVQTVLGVWYIIEIEGEKFIVRFPTSNLIDTVDIAPVSDSTPNQLKEMDSSIHRSIRAASNMSAHINRTKFVDVNTPTKKINSQPKTDIDWVQ